MHIEAVWMIEDWFLMDMDGLCSYLGFTNVLTLKGNVCFEKIKDWSKVEQIQQWIT